MKIEQKPEFQPITITLETAEEAEALWDAISYAKTTHYTRVEILADLSDWFSNHAKLGG